MIKRILMMLLVVLLTAVTKICAQSCPENIGFEYGNFQNWNIYAGMIDDKGRITVNKIENAESGRETIISDKNAVDPYGGFKVVPQNGSNFAVKLGNDGTGREVDQISYLIDVPANRPEFTLTYQYAVVLEDPNHLEEEQPRFIARVKDLEKNEYISCASYQYIATSGLPNFQRSKADPIVIYKDWTPVTINLSGYQGKQLLVEFITTDCTLGGHFGYAYVDVNNLCGSMIVGNTYCKNVDEIKLSGPSGFQSYNWYSADRSVKYGSGESITLKPTPPEGTKVVLDVIPFEGFGCPSTINAVIQRVDYQIQVAQENKVCQHSLVDLASSEFILNKIPDYNYTVYKDKDMQLPVTGTVKIAENSIYYVKAISSMGCESTAQINITAVNFDGLSIHTPQPVCYNETVDITDTTLYSSLTGITRTYFEDQDATKTLITPNKIGTAGTYYVKFTNEYGCSTILPVEVKIKPMPVLKITNPVPVCYPAVVDLTNQELYQGSDHSFTYAFYQDADLKQVLTDPKAISKSGTYYVKAVDGNGCSVSDKIEVTINALPVLIIKTPSEVCFPEKVDITNKDLYSESSEKLDYSYYYDQDLTNRINNPKAIAQSGTYFVKATNASGCYTKGEINVVINTPPTIVVHQPKAIFDTDFIDLTSADITRGSKDFVRITYFEDSGLQHAVSNPSKVNQAGTYYIALENDKGCKVSASVNLTVFPKPKIIVPTAFTPQKETNNRLYPFLVSIQKLTSFKVFNKWGIMVYQSADLANGGWDGQFRSKMQPLETFSWFAEGIDTFGGTVQSTGKTILIL